MYSRMPRRTVNSSRLPSLDGRTGGRGVYVPPNYSGTAIGMEASPTPRFDDLPQVSNLPDRQDDRRDDRSRDRKEGDCERGVEDLPPADVQEVTPVSAAETRNSLTGGLMSHSHFPFGHGLGYEELFLMGLLLFLLKETPSEHGDSDGDDLPLTLLLIGALLFCG